MAVNPENHQLRYLAKRHLDHQAVCPGNSSYFTERGICFLLYGQLGYQERITVDGYTTRFMFPSGVDMLSAVFFPHETEQDHLFIVEGSTDGLAIADAGLRGVALMGSNVTERKASLIKSLIKDHKKAIIIPDNDAPGQYAVTKLGGFGVFARILRLPDTYKDICDVPGTEVRRELLCRFLGSLS